MTPDDIKGPVEDTRTPAGLKLLVLALAGVLLAEIAAVVAILLQVPWSAR
jgi:hypothetical protein